MTPDLSRWHGKTALVTGASSGIGAAIAESLGAAGLKVALAGRDRRRLAAVAKRIQRDGTAFVVPCDQTRLSENARLFRAVRRRWGAIDVLVNCAGVIVGSKYNLLASPGAAIYFPRSRGLPLYVSMSGGSRRNRLARAPGLPGQR